MSEKPPSPNAPTAEIGRHVIYLKHGKTENDTTTWQDGIVIGFEPKTEAQHFPAANIALIDPERKSALQGSNWRAAFDRVLNVPHSLDAANARHSYAPHSCPAPEDSLAYRSLLAEYQDIQGHMNEIAFFLADKYADNLQSGEKTWEAVIRLLTAALPKSEPSADDLDKVADEQKQADATEGTKKSKKSKE